MPKKPETLFKDRVRKDLKTLPSTWFVKIQQVAIRGIPDFLLCVDGLFIAIELKASRLAKRDPLQEWTLEAIAKCGGRAFICYPENWDDTFQSIKEIADNSAEYVTIEDGN
jgi:hypothetical protein